jgi:hypothetical protein
VRTGSPVRRTLAWPLPVSSREHPLYFVANRYEFYYDTSFIHLSQGGETHPTQTCVIFRFSQISWYINESLPRLVSHRSRTRNIQVSIGRHTLAHAYLLVGTQPQGYPPQRLLHSTQSIIAFQTSTSIFTMYKSINVYIAS